jgi:Domain of unknown function (DUF4386)
VTDRPIPRLAALSGLAAVVLVFVGSGIGGSSPDLGASRATIAAWVADQHASTASYAGGLLELLGILTMIVFAATLWSVLRRAEGEDGVLAATAFGAGLVSAALKLASAPALFAAVWRSNEHLDPQFATALVDMNNVAFVLTWTVDAVMLGAAAIVILRTRALPRWLGWLAAATAAISLLSAPLADRVPPIGILLTFVWIIAISVVLFRRPAPRLVPAANTTA